MAEIFPPKTPRDAPRSEREVYRALATLPDPWVVIHDIPVGEFAAPKPGLEQLDFLAVHPDRGLTVIEVKGGAIHIDKGVWYTTPHGSSEPKALRRSPVKQAVDQLHAIQRYFWKHGLKVPADALAYAVALPDCRVEQDLGPDAPVWRVLDITALADPVLALEALLRKARTSVHLSAGEVERLIELLLPSRTLEVVLANRTEQTVLGLERETRRQVNFTESQVAVFQETLRQSRAVVFGEAGTGKTVLAIERARRLVETGSRTLLLCHRAAVFAYIITVLGDSALPRRFDPTYDGSLSIAHWTGLQSGLSAPGESWPPHGSAELPDAMLACAERLGVRFDAIVVDEGQEFTPQQFDGLSWLLTDPESGPFYVFADPFQHSGIFTATPDLPRDQLRGSYRWPVPFEAQPLYLLSNVRNAREIADAAGLFFPDRRSEAVVGGQPPEFLVAQRRRDVIAAGVARVAELTAKHGFSPNQVMCVLIGINESEFLHEMNKSQLHAVNIKDLHRFPLTPLDLRIAHGSPDFVQGLEAEVVVVIVWHDEEMTVARARDLYVAFSRARAYLIVSANRSMEQLDLAARVAFMQAAHAELSGDLGA
jgi:hypothetical protein